MSSFAVRADNVAVAAASSLNSIAPALLYPIIWAWVIRSWLSRCRKETRSYIRKLAEERIRAMLLVSIVISVSFLLMDRFWRIIRASLHLPGLVGRFSPE